MRYYKIVFGFSQDEYIPITEDELPKAIALFMEGKGRGLFLDGAIRAQDIQKIVPDWHRAKGWNKGWKMTPDDYEAIAPLAMDYKNRYAEARNIAEFALKENRRELLNQPLATSVLELRGPKPIPLLKEVETLSEKMTKF